MNQPAPQTAGGTGEDPGRQARGGEEFVLANHGKFLFFLAMLVSLAIHGGLGKHYANRSFIWVNPKLLGQDHQTFVVQRAPQQDIVVDMTPLESPRDAQDQPDSESDKPEDLSKLSEALLEDQPPAQSAQQVSDETQLRQLVENQTLLKSDPSLLDASLLPPVQLPRSVRQAMAVKLPVEVKFHAGDTDHGAGAESSGTEVEIVSDTARHILLGSGLVSGANPKPLKLKPPEFSEQRSEVIDQGLVQIPLVMPKVDFTDLALKGATKIHIPEKLDHDFDYYVTRYIPKAHKRTGWFSSSQVIDDDRGYFRVDIVPRKSLKRLPTMPKDVVFLIDTSGSVAQTWVDQVVRGVRDSLSTLGKQDRFNIVFFNENPIIFNPSQIQPATEENLAKARQFLKDRHSKGYTDVNHALTRLLVRDLDVARVYNLIMISDGRPTRGVMDTRELINLITRDNDLVASIYGVGVSSRQNRTLLEFLAYRNKGFCVFADSEFNVAQVIRNLMSRLRYPIMKDVRMSLMGIDPEDVYPRDLPNLYQGERFVIYGRFARNRKFTMRLVGHNGKRVLDLTFSKQLARAKPGESKMAYDWAFWKLHHLYSEMLRRGESQRVKKEIDALRRQYKLKTLY